MQDTGLKNQGEPRPKPKPFSRLALKDLLERIASDHFYEEEREGQLLPDLVAYRGLLLALLQGTPPANLFADDKAVKYFFEEALTSVINSILVIRKFNVENVLATSENIIRDTVRLLFTDQALADSFPKAFDALKPLSQIYRKFYSLNSQLDEEPQLKKKQIQGVNLFDFAESLQPKDKVDLLITEGDKLQVWCAAEVFRTQSYWVRLIVPGQSSFRKVLKTSFTIAPPGSCRQPWRQQLKQGDQVDIYEEGTSPYWQTKQVISVQRNQDVVNISVKRGNSIAVYSVYSLHVMPASTRAVSGWYRDDFEDDAAPEGEFAAYRPAYKSVFLHDLVNTIGREGWFQKLIGLIQKDLQFQLTPNLITMIVNIQPVLLRRFLKEYLPRLQKIVLGLLLQKNQTTLRSLTKTKCQQILVLLSSLKKLYTHTSVRKFLLGLQTLEIGLHCVRCAFLERKLQGLGAITQLIKTSRSQSYYYSDAAYDWQGPYDLNYPWSQQIIQKGGLFRNGTIVLQFLQGWLSANHLIDDLYMFQNHLQVIQKANQLVFYLALQKMLPVAATQRMWACAQKCDPQAKQSILNCLCEIGRCLGSQHKDFIMKKLQMLQVQKIGLQEMNLASNLSTASSVPQEVNAGIKYLWRFFKLSKHEVGSANSQQGLRKIVSSLKLTCMEQSRRNVFDEFVSEFREPRVLAGLIAIVNQSLYVYENQMCVQMFESILHKGLIEEVILMLPAPHARQFVQFFLTLAADNQLSVDLIYPILIKAWEALKLKPQLLFTTQVGKLLEGICQQHCDTFFKQQFDKAYLAQLTVPAFQLFKRLLLGINKKHNFIKYVISANKNQLMVSPKELVGYSQLVQLLFSNDSLQVLFQVLKLFDSLFEMLSSSLKSQAVDLKDQFLKQCLQRFYKLIQSPKENSQKLAKFIQIFISMLGQSQSLGNGGLLSTSQLREFGTVNLTITNQFNQDSQNKKIKMQVSSSITLYELRLRIAQLLNAKISQFEISYLGAELKGCYNGETLFQIGFKQNEDLSVVRFEYRFEREPLVLTDGTINPLAKRAFQDLFLMYSTNGGMNKEQCYRFLQRCTGQSYYVSSDQRVERLFQDQNKDKDGLLKLKQFCSFYEKQSKNHESVVWSNMEAFGVRPDLKRFEQLQQPCQLANNLPRANFIKNRDFIQPLFKLLDCQNQSLVQSVKRLINRLPPSPFQLKLILQDYKLNWLDTKNEYLRSYRALLAYQSDTLLSLSPYLQVLQSKQLTELRNKWQQKVFAEEGDKKILSELGKIQDESLIKLLKVLVEERLLQSSQNVGTVIQLLQNQKLILPENIHLAKAKQLSQSDMARMKEVLGKSIQLLRGGALSDISIRSCAKLVAIVQTSFIENGHFQDISLTAQTYCEGLALAQGRLYAKALLSLYAVSKEIQTQAAQLIFQSIEKAFQGEEQGLVGIHYQLMSAVAGQGLAGQEFDRFARDMIVVVLQKIRTGKMRERSFNHVADPAVLGSLKLLCSFLSDKTAHLFQSDVKALLREDLFGPRARFRTKETRGVCYEVLIKLLQIGSQKVGELRRECRVVIEEQIKRIAKQKQSYYLHEGRSELGYAGIKNLGCICYMISMIQQLFFQPSFRCAVLLADDKKAPAIERDKHGREYDDNAFHQFQKLFAGLALTERGQVNPEQFCLSFKNYEGQSVNTLVQQDAQQFFNMLFDKLESGLKQTPFKNILQDVFGGKTCNQLKCLSCGQVKSRSESFFSLSLQIKGEKNLQGSFRKFVQEETISDFQCQFCQKKTDVSKRTLLRQLPNCFVLQLQRICFNYEKYENEKINSRLEFPRELDVSAFTEQQAKQKPQPVEAKYRLKGVVVHIGSADSGHYYSYVNVAGQNWLQLNDERVREFDPAKLESECFGGAQEDSYYYWRKESCKSAYLLVYDKIEKQPVSLLVRPDDPMLEQLKAKVTREETQGETTKVFVDLEKAPQLVNESVRLAIESDNQQFSTLNYLSAPEFNHFVMQVVSLDIEPDDESALNFCFSCFLALRKESSIKITENLAGLVQGLLAKVRSDGNKAEQAKLEQFRAKQEINLHQWLCVKFCTLIQGRGEKFFIKKVETWKNELVTGEKSVRRCVQWMAAKTIVDFIRVKGLEPEPKSFERSKENAGHLRLINYLEDQTRLMSPEGTKHWYNFGEYFQFWCQLVQESTWVVAWMNSCDFLQKLLTYALSQGSQEDHYLTFHVYDSSQGKICKLVCLILGYSDLAKIEKPLYFLKKQELKQLASPSLVQKAIEHSDQLLSFLFDKVSCGNSEYSELLAGSLLREISRISHSEHLKMAMRFVGRFFSVDDDLMRQRCEWLLGVPKLKRSIREGEFGYGLYCMSSLEDEVYSYPTTLFGQVSLLDNLLRCYRNADHIPVVIIGNLLNLMVAHPTVFNYLAALPSPLLHYGRFIDWFPSYLERYKEYITKPQYTQNYQQNVKFALKNWTIVHKQLVESASTQRAQRYLQLENNMLHQINLSTAEPTYSPYFQFPLILGKKIQLNKIQQIVFGDVFELKLFETVVAYIEGRPTGLFNEAIPSCVLRPNKKRQEVLFYNEKMFADSPKAANFLNKLLITEAAQEVTETPFADAKEQGLVRFVLAKNRSNYDVEVSARVEFGEESDIFVPRTKTKTIVKSHSQVVLLTMVRLPGQSWPSMSLLYDQPLYKQTEIYMGEESSNEEDNNDWES